MSALRSAIDEMAAVPDDELSIEELDADIDEIAYARDQLNFLLARKTKSQTERKGHDQFGYPSPTAYLKDRSRMSAGHAKRFVSMAHAMGKAAVVTRAWADGRISTDQAAGLFSVMEAVPGEFAEVEEALVEIVEPLSVSDTRRALEYWRQSVDGPGELSEEAQTCPSWYLLMPPPSKDDDRTTRQRRHDALEDLALSYLDHGDTPNVGGEKPPIMVLADLDALKGIAGGTPETLNGEVLEVGTVRRLACDASISRIVLGPEGEILDVGRKTRVWSPAQRRAIIARDRHCVEPGCDRPPDWCDIHHKTHWADEGETSVESGEFRCRYHHTREHVRKALARLETRRRS